MNSNRQLFFELENALSRAGRELGELTTRSEEIILFGSRAVGVENEGSDWDLLCVGKGERFNRSQVDIIWVERKILTSSNWLGSELAGHVSKYGKWLKGEGGWRTKVFVSENTKSHKEQKITARISGLSRSWQYLSGEYRLCKIHKLRQDAQRLIILKSGEGVPPKRILDLEWQDKLEIQITSKKLLIDLASTPEFKRFIENIVIKYL